MSDTEDKVNIEFAITLSNHGSCGPDSKVILSLLQGIDEVFRHKLDEADLRTAVTTDEGFRFTVVMTAVGVTSYDARLTYEDENAAEGAV